MISLENFGWNHRLQTYFNENNQTHLHAGRIISIKGFKYLLISTEGELEAELSGKMLYTSEQEELPKVGDWVLYSGYESLGYIVGIFPRKNAVCRKIAGKKSEKQILAANIDYALIVQGLDRDFNLMRLERYLVQMANCQVEPIVILNKADLVPDHEYYRTEINRLNRNCPVFFCSTYTGFGITQLKEDVLKPHATYIMIGSSGVGKSSMLNTFMSGNIQEVESISDFTGKGKHTTTTRDLFKLPNGSLLIDTPGMREFGITAGEDLQELNLFPSIEDFAFSCLYADCQHINEPDCGVLKALEEEKISRESYESYLKLIKEQRRFEMKAGDRKRMGKQFGKMSREAKEYRKRYKF